MSLMVKESKDFEIIEEGTYTAVCYGVVDLGMQYSEQYEKTSNKIMFLWELVDEVYELDGKEYRKQVSKQYTLSLSKKSNMRKDLEAWRGKAFTQEELGGFYITKLVGVPCLLQIQHNEYNGKKYANINSIMRLPKNMEIPSLENEQILYDFDKPDKDAFGKLPEWIQTKIKEAKNYASDVSDGLKPVESEDLPF